MFRITAYAMPVLYALLAGAVWILQSAQNLPPAIAGLKNVFDFSLLVMIGIFWAVYFLAKRNLFDPLAAVMDRRERFVRERLDAHARAEKVLEEAQEAFDRRLREVRNEEQAALEALRHDITQGRERALARERDRMRKELDAARARLDAEGASARKDLEPAVRSLAGAIINKVMNRHVA